VSRRIQLAFVLAILAAALTAVPNSLGAKARLTEAAGQFPDRAFVLTLPTSRSLTTGQVQVRENGIPVSDLTVTPASAAETNQFGVVLVIDASDSMKGKPIAGAVEAAQLFIGHRLPSQQVAVVTFNNASNVALPFTADSGEIVQALAHRPALAYGTHLYDAVSEGISLIKDAKITVGSIVVLSDGADTGSKATRADVSTAARKAHVRVFAVALRSRTNNVGALRSLSNKGGGSLTEATSVADLSRIYDQLGTQLSHEYLLHYRSGTSLGTKVRVSVRVQNVGGALESGYATPPLPEPGFQSYHRGSSDSFWTSPFTMIVFSVFAVFLVASCVLVLLVPKRRTFQRRLAEFVSLAQPSDGKSVGGNLPQGVVANTEGSLEGARWWKRFVEEVELAEIDMSPAHILIWTLVGTIAIMWIGAIFFTYAALLLGFFVPIAVWALIRRKVERKRRLFAEQLPDNLAVLASAIRAGHSFVGALSVVVEDAPEPAQSEFRRVVADEQLGRPLEDALEVVVVRMNNQDLAQVALVAVLQRETGGSTAEVLERVVDTVRERQELRRLIRTLTAAGRMSRWVVSMLPVALLLAISILSPKYLKPLFAHTSGRILLVFAALLVISGSLVIKRIVDIKV
jgi:tight adherence protein B